MKSVSGMYGFRAQFGRGGSTRVSCAVEESLRWCVIFLSVMLLVPDVDAGLARMLTPQEVLKEQRDHRVWEQAGGCKAPWIYLDAFPDGLHAGEARTCLEEVRRRRMTRYEEGAYRALGRGDVSGAKRRLEAMRKLDREAPEVMDVEDAIAELEERRRSMRRYAEAGREALGGGDVPGAKRVLERMRELDREAVEAEELEDKIAEMERLQAEETARRAREEERRAQAEIRERLEAERRQAEAERKAREKASSDVARCEIRNVFDCEHHDTYQCHDRALCSINGKELVGDFYLNPSETNLISVEVIVTRHGLSKRHNIAFSSPQILWNFLGREGMDRLIRYIKKNYPGTLRIGDHFEFADQGFHIDVSTRLFESAQRFRYQESKSIAYRLKAQQRATAEH